MYRITPLIPALGLGALPARASPPFSGCTTVDHCSIGYYCDTALRLCRKCLECEDLGRKGPEEVCVKSVAECGGCLEGLVLDTSSEQCASPQEPLLPPYWIAAAAGLLLFGLFILAFAVYAFRKKEIFKSACTTTPSTLGRASDPSEEPSAPQPPPPYNEVVALPKDPSEESCPFIEPVDSSSPPRYYSAERQAAVLFNNPLYPPSDEELPMMPEPLPTIQEVPVDSGSARSRSTQSEPAEVVSSPQPEGVAKPGAAEQRSSGNPNDATPESDNTHTIDDSAHTHSEGVRPAVFVTIVNHNSLQHGNYLP